jgi:C4-dicarboxylate-specific signal transduction histidine kinase
MTDHMLKYIDPVDRPVLNVSGNVDRFVCTLMDVTERKHAHDVREALGEAEAGLARLSRVNTMAESSVSLTHELTQPIAATLLDANTCLSWLVRDPLNLRDKRAAAMDTADGAKGAADITKRLRQFFKKGTSQWELVDLDEITRE